MPVLFGFDAYSPAQIAERVETVGVAKARLPLVSLVLLGMLAGAFIGFGALFSTLAASDPSLGFAAQRLLMGLTFSLGLVLVVVAGAELFTGNNLLVMAWADRKISTTELLRNWLAVYIANAVGAIGLVLLVFWSHHADMAGGNVGAQYVKIAAAKTAMPFAEAFFKGVLCNALVCLAVWLTLAGHTVTDKILAILFPISAFVAAGFEHSVANMYFIPLGILLHGAGYGAADANVTWLGLAHNLLPVTLGNIFGGSVMVALVYYLIYRRNN
jgi:formate transporter